MNTNNQAKFITLGQLILQKISTRTLATGIENEGIYTWDRFDRLAVTCETNKAFILDLLADQYKYETHFGAYVERNGTPLSPLEKYELVPQSAEEAKDWDWDNPFDQFGWSADVLPDFNNIHQSQIEAEPQPINKVNRKAPDSFVAAFVRLLVEIAKRDPTINIEKMPGTKPDLLAVASKFDARLDHTLTTFDSYIGGLCKLKHGARPSDYYKNLFPEFFKGT